MDFLKTLFSDNFIEALGWTVVHSLWQAAIIAILLYLICTSPKVQAAKVRYGLANLSLGLLFAFSMGTFIYYFEPMGHNIYWTAITLDAPYTLIHLPTTDTPSTSPLIHFFQQNMDTIVGVWAVGFLFFLLRLIGGLAYLEFIKYNYVQPLSDTWQQKVATLSLQLNIKERINVLESSLVQSPMVIGYFKPIILFPIGVINQLETQQVEAILAHELAHIARHDFLLNFLQSLLEVIYYFNPAVWWISSIIRQERENCCDDIAVELCGNSITYAKALMQLRAYSLQENRLALGFAGNNKNQLLHRIQRILKQSSPKSNIMEKCFATCLLLVALMVLTVNAQDNQIIETPPSAEKEVEEKVLDLKKETATTVFVEKIESTPSTKDKVYVIKRNAANDTLPLPSGKHKQRIIQETDEQKVELEIIDEKVTQLKIDGKDIPEEEIKEHEALINKIREETLILPPPPMPPGTSSNQLIPPLPPLPPGQRIEIKKEIEVNKEGQSIQQEYFEKQQQLREDYLTQIQELRNEQEEKQKEIMEIRIEKQRAQLEENKAHLEELRIEMKEEIELKKEELKEKLEYLHYNGFHQAMEKELLKDGLIKTAKKYRLNFSAKKLKVNGKKQSEEVLQKYLDLYERFHEKPFPTSNEMQIEKNDTGNKDKSTGYLDQEKYFDMMAQSTLSNQIMDIFESYLLKDKLVQQVERYSLVLNDKHLKINGKKQADKIYQKYVKLYEELHGKKLEVHGGLALNSEG